VYLHLGTQKSLIVRAIRHEILTLDKLNAEVYSKHTNDQKQLMVIQSETELST
jgi:hypothetical protein